MSPHSATILILTPMKNAAPHLARYFALLERLSYPHHLLSLGILEGDSDDDTHERVARLMADSCSGFADKQLFRKHFGRVVPAHLPRHVEVYQSTRRAVLARARTHLLFGALRAQDWVLWLDADVIDYPPDIIERLIAFDLDIVHPHCVTDYGGKSFDRNAWVANGQTLMEDLRGRERVRLDSVGGTMLLIRADRHRDGLVFPAFFYGAPSRWARRPHPMRGDLVGEIETEGLALMAKDMGLECWGLPDLEILHAPV